MLTPDVWRRKSASELQRQTILVSARSFMFQIEEKKKHQNQTQDLENIVGMERAAKRKFALASTEVHQAIPIIQQHFLCYIAKQVLDVF